MSNLAQLICDMCGKQDETVGFSGCNNPNHAHIKICKHCDIDGYDYNGWDDECLKEEEEQDPRFNSHEAFYEWITDELDLEDLFNDDVVEWELKIKKWCDLRCQKACLDCRHDF